MRRVVTNRQDVFLSDEDRQRYLYIFREHSERHDLRVLGWCLMSNHVHLVAVPGHAKSLAQALSEARPRYSLEWNRRHAAVGHLWQNRFFSCRLEAQGTRMRVAKQRQEPTFFERRA